MEEEGGREETDGGGGREETEGEGGREGGREGGDRGRTEGGIRKMGELTSDQRNLEVSN